MPQVSNLLLALALSGFWIWALVDAAKIEDAAYRHANQSKGFVIVCLAIAGVLAGIVYVLAWRPKLMRMRAALR